jgi:glycine/D-amino acid oxidase-like deaminating enzyme
VLRARTQANARHALAAAKPGVYWLDDVDAPPEAASLKGAVQADLAIIGSGFTGLWAALQAVEESPGRSVVVLEAATVADGASGRNGGFVDGSLTHGLANGRAQWPDEVPVLERLADENFAGLVDTVRRHEIDCDLELNGELDVATAWWQLEKLHEEAEHLRAAGQRIDVLDRHQLAAQVNSPTYIGGVWRHDRVGLVDPARLAWGLRRACEANGVRFFDRSPVTAIDAAGSRAPIVLTCPGGSVSAQRVVVATNAYAPPLRSVRHFVVPVYDYVLVTEPLSAAQLAAIGWSHRQGIGDSANQFHYYRLTEDNRILWGGYDAIYYYGNRIDPSLDQRDETQQVLAEHFFETFPDLEGLRFTHRWGGVIATTSRFTCAWGRAHDNRLAWVAGYTGLGVGASRFGARVALDLADGRTTERTELAMVRRKPVPFPPEPLRWVGVQLTRKAIQRADANHGREGLWLKGLGKLGIGFDS